MSRHTSSTASPDMRRRRIAKTGTPCATRSVRASVSAGIRALTHSSTRDTGRPRKASWAKVPPGHGSRAGSETGVPATRSSGMKLMLSCSGSPRA